MRLQLQFIFIFSLRMEFLVVLIMELLPFGWKQIKCIWFLSKQFLTLKNLGRYTISQVHKKEGIPRRKSSRLMFKNTSYNSNYKFNNFKSIIRA
jgi:hypothetical protein